CLIGLPLFAWANGEMRFPFYSSLKNTYGTWEGAYLDVPGKPPVPKITYRILLPFGKGFEKVELALEPEPGWTEKVALEPAPYPKPLCEAKNKIFSHETPKGDSAFYPEQPVGTPALVEKHGYKILYVDVYPARYEFESKILTWLPKGEIIIHLKNEPIPSGKFSATEADQKAALMLADEATEISSYPATEDKVATAEYLVIGPAAFFEDESIYSLKGLMLEKQARGISTKALTVEDIQKSYTGSDTQAKIREAVKINYQEEGTRYLLLVGNGYSLTPTKILTVNLSEGSLPSDLYFGCLDGDFKSKPYDMACEVAVGRAPASKLSDVHVFVQKSLILQDLPEGDSLVWKTVNFGEKMDNSTYASMSLKMLELGGIAGQGVPTVGYPSQAEFFKLYETPKVSYSSSAVVQNMTLAPFYTLNHLGHCQTTYCLKIKADLIPQVKTSFPFFGITQGCFPGNMRQSNWASQMINLVDGGAGALVANSNYGWYEPGGANGHSNRLHTMFYDTVFKEGSRSLGKTLYRAKERLIDQANSNSYMRWVLYETNLFGDPEVMLKFPK
ncbi:MAG: C25 family cysteine peptidase, partial [Pseudomonadota bacterium]